MSCLQDLELTRALKESRATLRQMRQSMRWLSGIAFMLTRVLTPTKTYAQAKAWPPNQPPGFVTLTSWPFTTAVGGGWSGTFQGTLINDAAAPLSAPGAVHNYRNATSNHGGDFSYDLPSGTREFFLAYSVKLSLPHYGWFNGQYQKLHLIGIGPPHMYLYVYDLDNSKGTGSFQQSDAQASTPNGHVTGCSGGDCRFPCNVSTCSRSLGEWHTVEIYYKAGNGNGILRQYLDGVLTTSYSNLKLPVVADSVCLCNIWDLINSSLPQMEYVEYDHAYVSVPGVVTPPSTPTGIKVM